MSDIYKNRQTMPVTVTKPKRRRRRSSSRTVFDDTGEHRRRSRNSGFRRMLHLFRKPANEKKVWVGMLIVTVVLLSIIAIWQFLYVEHAVRVQSRQDEMYTPPQLKP